MNTTGSMTKAELVEEVSRVSDLTKKHSEVIVDTVFKSIIDALHRGEKIELRGFGSFRLRRREPRKGRNPKTGDKVDVPPKKVPYFKPGKELKELINREPDAPGQPTSRDRRGRRRRVTLERLYTPWRLAYVTGAAKSSDCVFCAAQQTADADALIVLRGSACFVILNLFPYNNGHLMVVPNRHIATLVDARPEELHEMMEFTRLSEMALREAFEPHGLNVGINLGKAAGAGILEHLHIHLVPRWTGDTNFMTVIGQTRVLPQELPVTAERLRPSSEARRRLMFSG